ncbi:putative ribonuclease H-like domain-containing protein [Tanacetum coccineum]|uniref:Ribonuclease H-like domain-containing protein n=1 Tax=Tanacetum coccineum TaxID=301880 RepID=A0ABQ5EP15_9ASTR
MAVMICQKSFGYSNSPMIHVLRVGLVTNYILSGRDVTIPPRFAIPRFNKATDISHYMVLEGVLMKNQDAAVSRDIQLICAEFSSIQVKPQADWMYVVPTGRSKDLSRVGSNKPVEIVDKEVIKAEGNDGVEVLCVYGDGIYGKTTCVFRSFKNNVPAPVPTGRQNRPFPVPTDRRYSPSVTSGRSNDRYMERLDDFSNFKEICDKKNRVLFTDTDCLVLSKDFMLPDESMVVLRVPRKHNLYTINLNNLSPRGNLACLVAKASVDESVKWHRRMGHVNYKNMNRLVKGNLVRGLPPKLFKNDHTCVACCKGKQHKASYKAITVVSSISEPLQLLHIDLFGPTSIRSIDHKYYCLVITDDYSRFCWVFFLEHKDETYPILKDFINLVENQLNKKVKAIRCDNGTEFKNAHIIELCGSKGIKRDYSNARTPQQNGVAERKNRTLIEAARTMLADLFSHFKPFGCHVSILNTSDHLGKFDGKADEGYIVGYSASNRAYRVYNVPNKRVEETMNLRYLEEKPNVQGLGHEWSQDADSDSECDKQVIIVHLSIHSIQEVILKNIGVKLMILLLILLKKFFNRSCKADRVRNKEPPLIRFFLLSLF